MKSEKGSVLLITLVILIILTVLTVAGFKDVYLQNKITNNRLITEQLKNSADIALREGEMRLFGSLRNREKIDDLLASNCTSNFNTKLELNIPCLVPEFTDPEQLKKFYLNPNSVDVIWQAVENNENTMKASFNSYLVSFENSGSVEWSDQLEGAGTYYYLVNGKAEERDLYTVQSIVANFFVGLNN
ncbi:hypothetical protein VQ643_01125 [Pseudomonas sp. F1_0610]|uniref:hypothetical protein n=1 Tax=Pseudomonas sp. F1_0610 TaxID=3114284 RepID=UPI0039C240B0